jgi:hypothetical protein
MTGPNLDIGVQFKPEGGEPISLIDPKFFYFLGGGNDEGI